MGLAGKAGKTVAKRKAKNTVKDAAGNVVDNAVDGVLGRDDEPETAADKAKDKLGESEGRKRRR